MFGILNDKKYRAIHETENIYTLVSRNRCEGFVEYINVLGKVSDNTYVKEVRDIELDYLYEVSQKVQYKRRWYNLTSNLNNQTILDDFYVIQLSFLDSEEKELAEKLGFERTDKFYYTKRLYRSDIEALKVVETPLGIFSSQGKKEKILFGDDIDNYLEGIVNESV